MQLAATLAAEPPRAGPSRTGMVPIAGGDGSVILVQPAEPGWATVTFQVPAVTLAATIAVVGDFNDWDRERHYMAKSASGYQITIRVPIGRRYRFRYLLDRAEWQNDWQADEYEPNAYGGDDSVLDLSEHGPHRHELHWSTTHP